jgi:formyltetrahydrofolate-dependent phosphoribosylglycinamide formyltransferase
MTSRLVVLVSGNGTNLQALLDACAGGKLDARVVAVVSNKPDAYGLERARAAGIPAVVVPVHGRPRPEYDRALADEVAGHQPDLVVLAGWLRILTAAFLDRFPARVLNLHPARPGQFPGLHAIERAWDAHRAGELDAGGVMVHLVPDEEVDAGPVVAWRTVPFLPGDTLERYEARVHAVEHELLVTAVNRVLAGEGTLDGRGEEVP